MLVATRTSLEQALRELLVCATEDINRGRCMDALETLRSMIFLLEEYSDFQPVFGNPRDQ